MDDEEHVVPEQGGQEEEEQAGDDEQDNVLHPHVLALGAILDILGEANAQADQKHEAVEVGIGHEEEEVLVVGIAHAIVDPGTVVIHLEDTLFTH